MKKCKVCGTMYSAQVGEDGKKLSFFKVQPERLIQWEQALGMSLEVGQLVCEEHFHAEDVVKELVLKKKDETVLQTELYKRPRLQRNAVPLPCNVTLTKVPESNSEKVVKRELSQIEPLCSIQNKKLKLEETGINLQNVDIKLPPFWSKIYLKNLHFISFAKFDVTKAGDIVPSKEVRLTTYGEVEYRFYGKTVNITSLVTQIKQYQEMEEIISNFDIMGV